MNPQEFAISLDLINRHCQEPNRNRYESRYFWEELYPLIATAGFRSIEIPYEPVWQFGGRSGVPMNRRRKVPSLPAIGSDAYQAAPHGCVFIQRSKVTAARGETRL